jgi:hypothetical protein
MVVVRGDRFPGLSFGYFADYSCGFQDSPRWRHAISEAVDKIDSLLRITQASSDAGLSTIDRAALDWLLNGDVKTEFSNSPSVTALSMPEINFEVYDLADRWNLGFPFYGVFCHSDGLLPLLIPQKIQPHDHSMISDMLMRFGLPATLPERNPVL